MTQKSEVRVRIAPSPTGDPHVGTAYIGLFNYASAKKNGGKFILRIEDTDQARAKTSSDIAIMESLKWLGLEWDEGPDVGGPHGPYRQSERTEIYRQHAAQLIDDGKAYPCFCTAERLDEIRQKQRSEGQQTGYDGHCRDLDSAKITALKSSGQAFVVRLKTPTSGSTVFEDLLRGKVEIENTRIDDQVLLKSDGYPTYHLANVVDDHLMKISHVIRAEEWISSTPKHEMIYQAFGWQPPQWAHMPLLRNTDKSKISKRKNSVSLLYYRRAGYIPKALLNFLALMGWNPGNDVEIFSLDEMIAKLELTDINLGGPVFDLVKLAWMNQQYLQKLDDKSFIEILRNDFFSEASLLKIKPLMQERIQHFDEFFAKASFFFCGALDYSHVQILPKGKEKKDLVKVFKDLVERLDDLYDWDKEHIEALLNQYREEIGWKPKDFFMPLRLICSGREDSPPLVETLVVLGREIVRFRIRNALNTVLKG